MLQMRDLKSFCKQAEKQISDKGIDCYDIMEIDVRPMRVIFYIDTIDGRRIIEVEKKDNTKNSKLEDFM